jgi:hypothetical protein
VVQVGVVASGTHNVDMRKPRRRRLPGSPLLQIPDDVRSVMCKRVASRGWTLWINEFGWFLDFFSDLCGFMRLQLHYLGAFRFCDFVILWFLWFCNFVTSAGICICAFAGTHVWACVCACVYVLHVHTYRYVHVHVQLFMRSVDSLGCRGPWLYL